ncbi:hypothetical protein [Anaeromicrobium sediminis]|nr:hypothetical protein [Anaeromicrobium sediminis]
MTMEFDQIDLFNDILLILIATFLAAALLSGSTENRAAQGVTPVPIVIPS